VDRTPPSIQDIAFPAQPTPGAPMTVVAMGSDDVDLLTVSAHLVFPSPGGARLAIPFAAADSAGTPFDDTLATRFTASLTFPFVSTLTYPVSGRLVGARTLAADSLRVRVLDVALLATEQGGAIVAGAPNGNPFSAVDSVGATVDLQNVCTAGCLGTDATSTRFTVHLVGPSGFRNPLADPGRVHFFMRDSTGVATLLGSTSGASLSETGDRRVFTYSITVRPEAGLTGDFDLFAVGASAAGSGLLIGDARLRLFGR